MAKDIRTDEKGDFYINPATHDFELTDGVDEIAQRIKATLEIRYGEMTNLDPQQGADYRHFLGKNFRPTLASDDMTSAIEANVPEVSSVDNIAFTKLAGRKLKVDFRATATPTESSESEEVTGGLEFGT